MADLASGCKQFFDDYFELHTEVHFGLKAISGYYLWNRDHGLRPRVREWRQNRNARRRRQQPDMGTIVEIPPPNTAAPDPPNNLDGTISPDPPHRRVLRPRLNIRRSQIDISTHGTSPLTPTNIRQTGNNNEIQSGGEQLPSYAEAQNSRRPGRPITQNANQSGGEQLPSYEEARNSQRPGRPLTHNANQSGGEQVPPSAEAHNSQRPGRPITHNANQSGSEQLPRYTEALTQVGNAMRRSI